MRCMGLNVYTAVRYLAIGLVVTLCLASCCKETGDQYFCFSKEGGPIFTMLILMVRALQLR